MVESSNLPSKLPSGTFNTLSFAYCLICQLLSAAWLLIDREQSQKYWKNTEWRELKKHRDEIVKGALGTSAHSVRCEELIMWRVN